MWLLSKVDLEGQVLYVGHSSNKKTIFWTPLPSAAMQFNSQSEAESSWLCGWYFGTSPSEYKVQPSRPIRSNAPNPFAAVLNV